MIKTMARMQYVVLATTIICLQLELNVKATRNGNEGNVREVLRLMAERMIGIRRHNQYGVIYIPPPNNPYRAIFDGTDLHDGDYSLTISGGTNDRHHVNPVIYPPLENDRTIQSFPHNYAAMIPDRAGMTYGEVMGRSNHRTIHTEDLALQLVLPPMLQYYRPRKNGNNASTIYLYTYYLPCENCSNIIQSTLWGLPGLTLYMGYSEFQEDRHNVDNPQQRLQNLQNRLNTLGFQGSIERICSGNNWRHRRSLSNMQGEESNLLGLVRKKRSTNTCPAEAAGHSYVDIRMDFSSGLAIVDWYLPQVATPKKYIILRLVDARGTELSSIFMAYRSRGSETFDGYHFISNGVKAKVYHRNPRWERHAQFLQESSEWSDCGLGWREMNALNVPGGKVYMALSVANGYPKVDLAFCDRSIKNAINNHYIVLQGFNQSLANQASEIHKVTVSSMSSTSRHSHIFTYTFSSRLSSAYASGFRAKLVKYRSDNVGLFKEFYDNSTPFWLPDQCRGLAQSDLSERRAGSYDPCIAA